MAPRLPTAVAFADIRVSLHKYSLKRPRIFDFVGCANYQQILQSEEFWSALWIMLAFTALAVALVVLLGLVIALVLNHDFRGATSCAR